MIIYMMIGLPGGGKSYFAQTYVGNISTTIVSSDEIRSKFNLSQEQNNQTFKIVHERIEKCIMNDKDIIYDTTNINRKRRITFINWAKNIANKYNRSIRFFCLCLATPINICVERNSQRIGVAKVPDKIVNYFLKSFEMPIKEEGYDNIFFSRMDLTTFNIERSWCYNFDQENPHHTLSLGEHMDSCYEYIRKYDKNFSRKERDILEAAAKWHDIGKLFTKDFHNSKGEPTETAHYYGHENVGTYLMLSEIPWQDEQNLKELKNIYYEVAKMINFHMKVSFS